MISSRVSNGVGTIVDSNGNGGPDAHDEFRDSEKELNCIIHVLDELMELGFRRLKDDLVVVDESKGEEDPADVGGHRVGERELECLSQVILQYMDIFDALCLIIQKQVGEVEHDDSGLAITLRKAGRAVSEEEDVKLMKLIQRKVQLTHLDAIKVAVNEDDLKGAAQHIQYLHLDYGLAKEDYRVVFQVLLKKILSEKEGYGIDWIHSREKLLLIYQEALSSNCIDLVQMIQVAVQDELLVTEVEVFMTSNIKKLPLLQKFQEYIKNLQLHGETNDNLISLNSAISTCQRELYHYARVAGLHVLDCVIDAALSDVEKEDLEEASNILSLFPRLRPLVAIMGWDILRGKTAMRRKLMQLLWTSKSQVYRLEESALYGSQSDETSCIEHLCDTLCYQLDLAAYVASVNSGEPWNPKLTLFFSGQEESVFKDEYAQGDPFLENFVLERLSFQSPLRVLFDVVPNIEFDDAFKLISMQPISSSAAAQKRIKDVELMHMRFALEHAALAIADMEKSDTEDAEKHIQKAFCLLKSLRNHIEAINNIPCKVFMVNIIISLLHMNNISLNWSLACKIEYSDLVCEEVEEKTVTFIMEMLLKILDHNLPSQYVYDEDESNQGQAAMEWRISIAKSFIKDWEWRLSILQQLLPLSEGKWKWKEALTVLRAAPSKLLNLCMQSAQYEIGEEAVNRFSLSPEDKAILSLAEWVDGASKRASVEDAVSRASDGTTFQDIDISALRAQLGPLTAAQSMLSEIYPGDTPKIGLGYWDQIKDAALISLAKHLLKRLHEFLDQENSVSIQAFFSAEVAITNSHQQGQKNRALGILHQMIEDAYMGKRQFLSGKLHNLARALVDEESKIDNAKAEGSSDFEKDLVLGLGLRASKQASSTLPDQNIQSVVYDIKDTGKRLYGPLGAKPTTYLSQFILYIAATGDIVDGTDTTHDFNYFSLVYEWPKDLVTQLVFERGSTDAAEKAAEIMSADFVHEVISACVPPVYPPRSGHGWACIPLFPYYSTSKHGNQLLSTSTREANLFHGSQYSIAPRLTKYPLQLDVVKHLAKTSPVRAVLACVFGSRMLHNGSESSVSGSLEEELQQAPDLDRLFYEFALDQSERFPTLNRWIQMQTNLHRVSEFAVASKDSADDVEVRVEARSAIKRAREYDSSSEPETEENIVLDSSFESIPDNQVPYSTRSDPSVAPLNYQVPGDDTAVFLTFDWENEEPYEKAVERLIEEGNLLDALALSDRFLRLGASDNLLMLLIERDEESYTNPQNLQGYGGQSFWSNSWQFCLRLKDKHLAANLALKYLHRWELDAALDVLTMCSCHLPQGSPLKDEVLQRRQSLERYKHILCADERYSSWPEVEAACKEDPEGLALKLAEKGAVSAALEVAESAGLSIDLRRELQGRQLVKLLTADPLSGGGPAEASRFLSSLRDSDDALPVVMGAMQLLPNLRSKHLLVHFFLKRKDGNLSDAAVSRLNSWALGLKVLSALPLPWQQRCSSLHEHPHLIFEVLLMRKQLESASLILKDFPSLRENNIIFTYAAKAVAVNMSSPLREPRVSVSGPRLIRKKTGTPSKLSFTSSFSNIQKEARKAFSWAPRNVNDKSTPKETYRKRKSSGLMPAEKGTWEAMTGIQEDNISSNPADGQERLPSVSISEEWMLSGDPTKDDAVRSSHRYDSAPDIILFKSLLSLCSDDLVSAKGAMDLCVNQMKAILNSQQLPEKASMEIIGRAYHATETFVQGLLHSRSLLRKLVGGSDILSISDRSRDTDDTSSDAGSFSIGSQTSDEVPVLLSRTDAWLRHAELLQSLLGSGIAASLDDIADEESSARLRDRLIGEERYSMAVYTCRKCKIDVFPVWNSWGHALLRIEHYDQARVKFKQALQLYEGDPSTVITEIINTIEGGPPVDVSAARSMYEHLAKNAPSILDDSLSADSYLNILHMPSTFPRSERSRSFLESTSSGSLNSSDFQDGPRSNLDSLRYQECVNYLQDYARQDLLEFMFRHGHYDEASMLFFPLNAIPPPPQPSSLRTIPTSSSPQRPDPLATDYGTIDDLCELCVGYGAMPVLEEVIIARIANASSQDAAVNQHTEAALARICNYCETHKHFNYFYNFQVIRKDHVAAGLCCIQLFINSSSLEDAVLHLENAQKHFDEGLSARSKGGESTKLITKGTRGRSASEKLTEEGLIKLSARATIQILVLKSFNDSEGPQWKHSLFGNPNDPETFRRRCQIAETLAEKNYDLAFRLICEFNMPAVDIYAAVAASLAERKKGSQLTEFFKNIKGMLDDDDWDQVLGAAINVYANKHKERPDRLIDMLKSSHRKVLACVVCGRLKSAFQIASRSGSVADVQYVAHQALHANALPVLDTCRQWLAKYIILSSLVDSEPCRLQRKLQVFGLLSIVFFFIKCS
ncbi:hypothetical protein V2J09_005265 [Rumex salicifolius]